MLLAVLLILALVTGITTYAAALLPKKLKSKENEYTRWPIMKLVSGFSVGILISTLLILVIPEGVEILMDSDRKPSVMKNVGVSLFAGFFVMLLIDHQAKHANREDSSSEDQNESVLGRIRSLLYSPLTLGLVLHSLADGIGLGTAFLRGDSSFLLIYFLAIIVHKLPTAFSLAAILLREAWSDRFFNTHVIVFAASTPIASLATYLFIEVSGFNNHEQVARFMLFSAGTLFYSVIHVMSELNGHDTAALDQLESVVSPNYELGCIVAGMVVPIVLSLIGDE